MGPVKPVQRRVPSIGARTQRVAGARPQASSTLMDRSGQERTRAASWWPTCQLAGQTLVPMYGTFDAGL